MATFKVTGVNSIQRAFRELPRKVAGKVVRGAIRKGLAPMKAKVEELAPKESGTLAKSVKIRARPRKKRGIIALDVRIGAGDFKGETFYGAFTDLGTKKQPAQHFMERAFEATKEEAASTADTLIRDGIARELKS